MCRYGGSLPAAPSWALTSTVTSGRSINGRVPQTGNRQGPRASTLRIRCLLHGTDALMRCAHRPHHPGQRFQKIPAFTVAGALLAPSGLSSHLEPQPLAALPWPCTYRISVGVPQGERPISAYVNSSSVSVIFPERFGIMAIRLPALAAAVFTAGVIGLAVAPAASASDGGEQQKIAAQIAQELPQAAPQCNARAAALIAVGCLDLDINILGNTGKSNGSEAAGLIAVGRATGSLNVLGNKG